MQSKAKTVDAYLDELPELRREAIQAARQVILKNLPKGIEEGSKSCIRFKKIEDVPLDVVGNAIKRISVRNSLNATRLPSLQIEELLGNNVLRKKSE